MATLGSRGRSPLIGPFTSPTSFVNYQSKSTRHLSPDTPSDIVIEVDGVGFALQKALLCARSGHITKLLKHYEGPGPIKIMLPNVPGGAHAFEFAVKFCYGIEFEINASNIAALRCVAAYLEMTEEYGTDNLVSLTELFLREAVFSNLKECVQVLCSCGSALPQAEEVKLTSRCIDATASIIYAVDAELNNSAPCGKSKQESMHISTTSVWWVLELLPLPIDSFKQVMQVLKLKGLQAASIGEALMHYAYKALKLSFLNPLEAVIYNEKQQDQIMTLKHGQRIVLETIVDLLPAEGGSVTVAFLFSLVRTGFLLDTTVACRMELEKRIGAQLEQASLEELLVPSIPSHTGDTLFNVDFVHRIVVQFLREAALDSSSGFCHSVHESTCSHTATVKVARLLDSYMAEVAIDANLKVTKFVELIEQLPSHARLLDDGIYRAIDIYLKAHPAITDIEKRKICKLMDCRKLSPEACSHAAQNERLPVHCLVQVLFYMEQLRLCTAGLPSSSSISEPKHTVFTTHRTSDGCATTCNASPTKEYTSLQQENEELRLEVARMQVRLKHLEKKPAFNMFCAMKKTSLVKKLLRSVARILRRINPFSRANVVDQSKRVPEVDRSKQQPPTSAPPRRRYSIS